jgi:hypothetical protein
MKGAINMYKLKLTPKQAAEIITEHLERNGYEIGEILSHTEFTNFSGITVEIKSNGMDV